MDITTLYKDKKIDHIDWAFAGLIRRISNHTDPWVDLATALVSQAAANGHTCLDLTLARFQGAPDGGLSTAIPMEIDPNDWCARLAACPAVGVPGDFRPLILAGTRLYLNRYWGYEQYVARAIEQRSHPGNADQLARTAEAAGRLFGPMDEGQRRAACMAATCDFAVICGGPGTGKTFTLARIIVLLKYLAAEKRLRIALCAPTGKAAARLQEAMEAAVQELPADQSQILSSLEKARTIHRLLGPIAGSRSFRYHAGRPIPVDVVIVDEASMIDLALMARLMQALAPGTRLILSGDKDQLASVEAGAVLGDICHGAPDRIMEARGNTRPAGMADHPAGLKDQIVVLTRRYRFDDTSGICELGQAVNCGDAERVLAMLTQGGWPGLRLRTFASWAQMTLALEEEVLDTYGRLGAACDPLAALNYLKRFQILSVVRNGPYGVQALNAHVEKVLGTHGLILQSPRELPGWYAGRPVMVVRNDYHHDLFNGDMGIAVVQDDPFPAGGRISVFFPAGQDAHRSFAPHQLPPNETAYAMTVHKSQGSEFERIILILPDRDVPVLTRELIYTAVTRARINVEIWGDGRLLSAAIQRRIERASGLREALLGVGAHP